MYSGTRENLHPKIKLIGTGGEGDEDPGVGVLAHGQCNFARLSHPPTTFLYDIITVTREIFMASRLQLELPNHSFSAMLLIHHVLF